MYTKNVRENSLFGPFLKFASLFGPQKYIFPFLTLNFHFVPFMTLPSVLALHNVKSNMKKTVLPLLYYVTKIIYKSKAVVM